MRPLSIGTVGIEIAVDPECIDSRYFVGWPCVGLRFKEGSDVQLYLSRLVETAATSEGSFEVYTRDTMPERFHFRSTSRIAPIYVIPKLGWALTDHHEYEVIHEGDYKPKGNHGYDNIEADMQAIFFAHGPSFSRMKAHASRHVRRHQELPRGWVSTEPPVLESFRNLELFSLVTHLMGVQELEPPHNGTSGFWHQYLGELQQHYDL